MPYAPVNGTELFYETLGEGPPIFIMHGGLGHDHTCLRPWLDPLAAHHTLVYYDHRGNGASRRDQPLDHATWVLDADALRAHLGHERIVLFGHSYGSFLAQDYALAHGDRLRGLILCSSTPAFDYQPVLMQNAAARGTPEVLAALQAGLSGPAPDDDTFARIWMQIAPLYFHRPDPRAIAAMFGRTRFSAEAFNAGMFRCLPAWSTLQQLSRISIPALILSGADDWITPPARGGARLAAGISGAEHVVFAESGHYPFGEEPEAFIAAVERWLQRL